MQEAEPGLEAGWSDPVTTLRAPLLRTHHQSRHAPCLGNSSPPALHVSPKRSILPGPTCLSQLLAQSCCVTNHPRKPGWLVAKNIYIMGLQVNCGLATSIRHLVCVPGTVLSQAFRVQPASRGHTQDSNRNGKHRHCDRSCPARLRDTEGVTISLWDELGIEGTTCTGLW